MWQSSFIAMSIALGETLEDASAAIESPIDTAFNQPSREKRARVIAERLAPIAADIDAMELAWRS